MVDTTTPPAGVGAVAPTVESRLAAFLSQEPAAPDPEETQPEAEPEAKPEPVEAQAEGELTPEDIPDEEQPAAQPSADDAFEIVHNGTQHKLNREETIKLAQQGFDYTQKTQALAERAKSVDASLQRAAEIEQSAPFIASEQAQLAAFKSQLDQYEKVDWVQLASEQPLEYPKYRAQYDLLVNSYNQTHHRLTQTIGEVSRKRQEIRAEALKQEAVKLRELIPEWKNPEKYQAGSKELHSYLLQQGADPGAVADLADALTVSLARKAMLYDRLLKSKGEKSKLLQTAPPVARPGVNPSRDTAKADKDAELRGRLKKTGDIKDAAALLATRLR